MSEFDVSSMTTEQLHALIKRLEKEVQARHDQEIKDRRAAKTRDEQEILAATRRALMEMAKVAR